MRVDMVVVRAIRVRGTKDWSLELTMVGRKSRRHIYGDMSDATSWAFHTAQGAIEKGAKLAGDLLAERPARMNGTDAESADQRNTDGDVKSDNLTGGPR